MGASCARFVLPVILVEIYNIDAPNDDRLASLNPHGWIDEITPHDVPARVVIVRLECPRTLAALRFEALAWTGNVTAPSAFQIRESLLCCVDMTTLLLDAVGIECSYTEYTDERAKHVRLFIVDLYEIR